MLMSFKVMLGANAELSGVFRFVQSARQEARQSVIAIGASLQQVIDSLS